MAAAVARHRAAAAGVDPAEHVRQWRPRARMRHTLVDERIALAMVAAIDAQIAPLERELRQLARRQTGCRALMGLYGMGELTAEAASPTLP